MAGSLNKICRTNPDVQQAVHTLILRLGRTPSNLGSVRELITHALHVFTLTILITTRAPPRLLPSRRFENLTSFTTDLPHCYLVDFITRSPQLRCLSLLSDCRDFDECPLQGAVALSLDEIRCSRIKCIGSFHHSTAVETVVLITPRVRGESGYMPRAALPMSPSILNLRLPFSGTEIPTLVSRLLLSAPAVEALALEEYRGAYHLVRPLARVFLAILNMQDQDTMPFSLNRHVFASDLLRLRHLRALHLKLLQRVGLAADDETVATTQWMTACQQSESLRYVLIWSDTSGDAPGRVRVWGRTGRGAWALVTDRAGRLNESWQTFVSPPCYTTLPDACLC